MTKTPHNVGLGDHDRIRSQPEKTLTREQQRKKLLIESFRQWIEGGRKGTKPRKARLRRVSVQSAQTRLRAGRDRIKRKMTKRMQIVRLSRNQEVRSGGQL